MATTDHNRFEAPRNEVGAKLPLWLGLALCLATTIGLAAAEPYEHGYTRIGEIATGMVSSGDWIVQRFADGSPYFDKPPVFTWLIALPILATGGLVSWQQHVPGVLAFCLSLTWTGLLARRLFGTTRTGLAAALVLATTWGFPALVRTKRLDPIFAAWLTGTLYFAWCWLSEPRHERRERPAVTAWLLLALAVMTKGPLALLIVPLTVGLFAVWTGRAHRLATRGMLLGALLFTGLVALWPLLVVRELGVDTTLDTLRATRLATDFGGPLFYLAREPQVLLPWILFVPVLFLWRGSGASDRSRDGIRFLLCWLAAVVIPLELSPAKSPRYMLPAFPPFAILVASLWQGFELDPRSKLWRDRILGVLLWVLAITAGVAPVVFLAVGERSPIGPVLALVLVVPLGAASVAGLRLLRRGASERSFAWAALALALAFVVHGAVVSGDYMRRSASGRELAAHLAPTTKGAQVRAHGLDPKRLRIVVLATGRLVPEVHDDAEIAAWLRAAPDGRGLLVTRESYSDALAQDTTLVIEGRTPLIVDKRDLEVLELRAGSG